VRKLAENRKTLDLLTGGKTEFLKNLSPIFALTIFLYIFSFFMGYIMGDQISPEILEGIFSNIPDPSSSTNFEFFTALVVNNIVASFLLMILGLFLGIPSLLGIIVNGFLVGWVSYIGANKFGFAFVFLTLAPHGIIEIPTISLSAAIGVGLGYKIINRIRNEKGVRAYLLDSIKFFFMRIIPLLIVAAIIETTLILVYY
jgi:stage II sporulation protein M